MIPLFILMFRGLTFYSTHRNQRNLPQMQLTLEDLIKVALILQAERDEESSEESSREFDPS